MRKSILMIFVPFILVFIFAGCEKETTGLESGRGRLNVYMTDATASYDSVKITFSQVSAHIDSEWVTVTSDPVTVDLLKWTNGAKILIGSADVPAGKYTQIRIIIDDAEIGVDGEDYSLDVPSGAKTGLKFGPQFTIEEGSLYEIVCDFDVHRSIVVNGPQKGPKGYKLKPYIRMMSTAVAGSISGIVSNPVDLPIAYAIQGEDTLTSSLVNTTNGYFMLGFLGAGEYTVSILDTNDLKFNQDSVPVIVGENNDLGQVTLE